MLLTTAFIASVLNQLPIRKWHSFIARADPWTFLPFWGFFGPNPAYAGVHIVYRDRSRDGWSGWEEIPIPSPNGWRWLWNPARHERKALHDLINGLAKIIHELNGSDKIVLSSCYLALLAWVCEQARIDTTAVCRQFALVETIGHGSVRQVRPVYVSREVYFDESRIRT